MSGKTAERVIKNIERKQQISAWLRLWKIIIKSHSNIIFVQKPSMSGWCLSLVDSSLIEIKGMEDGAQNKKSWIRARVQLLQISIWSSFRDTLCPQRETNSLILSASRMHVPKMGCSSATLCGKSDALITADCTFVILWPCSPWSSYHRCDMELRQRYIDGDRSFCSILSKVGLYLPCIIFQYWTNRSMFYCMLCSRLAFLTNMISCNCSNALSAIFLF